MDLEHEIASLHGPCFGWALACCGREHELARDVLQEAYWKVLSGRAKFDGRAALKTWLFGVIRLTALEHRRWSLPRWLRFSSDGEPPEVPGPERAPDSSMSERERSAALASSLAKLADRQREVLHLVFYEELSIREAADVMGVALGTARLHYERGKARLEELLRERGVQ